MNSKKFNEALNDYLKKSYDTLVTATVTVKKYDEGMITIDEKDVIGKMNMENTKEAINKLKAEIDLVEGLFEDEYESK